MNIWKTRYASIFTALLLAACGQPSGGKNLDARCADVLEEVAREFRSIAEEGSITKRVQRLADLPQEDRIFALEDDINNWDGSINSKVIYDKLNSRKLAALTAANQARFAFRTDTTVKAMELDEEDDGKSAYQSVTHLFTLCNHTLR